MVEHMRDIPKDHSKRKDWWFVDRNGRKIGYMWPEDFLSIIHSIWGQQQGVKAFAQYAGFTTKTVYDWAKGETAIPKDVAQLLTCMQHIVVLTGAHTRAHPWREIPKVDADWLSKERQDEKFEVARKPFG